MTSHAASSCDDSWFFVLLQAEAAAAVNRRTALHSGRASTTDFDEAVSVN